MRLIKMDKQFTVTEHGKGITSYLKNHCNKCGWIGIEHSAHNDYQVTNCYEEQQNHICDRTKKWESK